MIEPKNALDVVLPTYAVVAVTIEFILKPADHVVYIDDHPMFVWDSVHIIHTDEEWMIADTVCRVLRLTIKKEHDHAG
jgi:hypothetical protein